MTALEAIDFGRWVFTIGATLCFIAVNVKTKWWRTGFGINVFCLTTVIFFTVVVINLAAYDFISGIVQAWLFAGIYFAFGLVLAWRGMVIWMLNKGYWVTTKDVVKDGN